MRGDWNDPSGYEIILNGCPDLRWLAWFEGLVVEALPDHQVRLHGLIADQAALHGVIERIRDSNLVIVSVRRLD